MNGQFSTGSIKSYFTKMLNSTPAVKKNDVFKATGRTERAIEEESQSVARGPQRNAFWVEEDQPIRQLTDGEMIDSSPRTKISLMTEKCPHGSQQTGHEDLEEVSSPRRANIELSRSGLGVETDAGEDRLCFTPELYDDEELVEEKDEVSIHNYNSTFTSFETANTVLVEELCLPNAQKPGDATSRFKGEAGADAEWWGILEDSQNNRRATEAAGHNVGLEESHQEAKDKENQLPGSQIKGVSRPGFT